MIYYQSEVKSIPDAKLFLFLKARMVFIRNGIFDKK